MILQLIAATLGPLALYLTWLGVVNRRPRPTAVSGPWDFVALAAGLSGFLLLGGGVLAAGLHAGVRSALAGNWVQVRAAWDADRLLWLLAVAGYVLAVGGFVWLGVRGRAGSLSVYNLPRDRAEAAVEAALADAGISATRFGDVWAAGGARVAAIDPFPGFRHVTVRLLDADPRVREELERGLRARLAATVTGTNPVAVWVMTAGVVCMLTALMGVAVLYVVFLARVL